MKLPEGVTLQKLEPRSYDMAVGDKRPGSRYRVLVAGSPIGEVWKSSSPTYRSERTNSRLLSGLMGYGVRWKYSLSGETFKRRPGSQYSLGWAVEALVRDFKEA